MRFVISGVSTCFTTGLFCNVYFIKYHLSWHYWWKKYYFFHSSKIKFGWFDFWLQEEDRLRDQREREELEQHIRERDAVGTRKVQGLTCFWLLFMLLVWLFSVWVSVTLRLMIGKFATWNHLVPPNNPYPLFWGILYRQGSRLPPSFIVRNLEHWCEPLKGLLHKFAGPLLPSYVKSLLLDMACNMCQLYICNVKWFC